MMQLAQDHDRKEKLAALRAELARRHEDKATHGVWRFGDSALDDALPPRALARGRLHEIVFAAASDQAAATGFAAALAGNVARDLPRKAVVWCQRQLDRHEAGRLYGPGFAALGCAPRHVIHICARRDSDVLWAMEEAITSDAVAVVVGEAARIDLTASRRLALAAEKSGVTAFLVRARAGAMSNAAWTRWQVAPAPSAPGPFDARAPGPARLHLHLLRARAGFSAAQRYTRSWMIEWSHETHRFTMVAPLADRAVQAAPARPAGRALMSMRRAG